MRVFRYAGIPDDVAATVRSSMRAPGYGHPAHREVARGYGPCRACLRTFRTGEEERILFTYQPMGEAGSLPAPGPVFIHAEPCERYDGLEPPPYLRPLPIVVEGFAAGGWLRRQEPVGDSRLEDVVAAVFESPDVSYVHLRNAEAGCFMARVERCLASD